MKFTLHSVGDRKNPVAWCALGDGRFFKSNFLESLRGKILLAYPQAEFEESFPIAWGDEQLLRQGIEAYRRAKPTSG